MTKIAFIGAGSTVFAQTLMGDLLLFPEFKEITIALHDIDAQRLQTSTIVAGRVADVCRAKPTIISTTDRRVALDGADYVICMIQVGGYKPATVIDFEIPQKYGLRQTIADTIGIGGIMRGLRTIPVLLDITRDMAELCPQALFLNYANPMAINMWAIHRQNKVRAIGLCHSVPHTAYQLATDLGVPYAEIDYLVAGINHMAFFLSLAHQGQDLYPLLNEFADRGEFPMRHSGMVDGVRYDLFKRLGYFVTESSEHLAEYVPWYIKRDRPDILQQFSIPLDEYIRRCEQQIAEWDQLHMELTDETRPLDVAPSEEYGAQIIHSLETGQSRLVYGNVPNTDLIANLPADCIVEVPCTVDAEGIRPHAIGHLPPHLAALMQTNINVQALTVEAALTQKREHVYHAAMLDPHTGAELALEEIWSMVDELIAVHGNWLPAYH
jgi:alpha-galactosidase